jgi:hypothetical protein
MNYGGSFGGAAAADPLLPMRQQLPLVVVAADPAAGRRIERWLDRGLTLRLQLWLQGGQPQ